MNCVHCGIDRDGEMPHTAEDCVERLELQVRDLTEALTELLIKDPHNLNDHRPCETCDKAHIALAKVTGSPKHEERCRCHRCRVGICH